jgi:hypothetical protein
VALIVLDTDVVSRYRAGRLPAGFARQVVTNVISVTFATAGELWKGAWPSDGAAPVVEGSTCGSMRRPSCPPE